MKKNRKQFKNVKTKLINCLFCDLLYSSKKECKTEFFFIIIYLLRWIKFTQVGIAEYIESVELTGKAWKIKTTIKIWENIKIFFTITNTYKYIYWFNIFRWKWTNSSQKWTNEQLKYEIIK
jgi:hypothetical protein